MRTSTTASCGRELWGGSRIPEGRKRNSARLRGIPHAWTGVLEAPVRGEGAVRGLFGLVGRTPWSAADALVGLCGPAPEAGQGAGCRPGGPPHQIAPAFVEGENVEEMQ